MRIVIVVVTLAALALAACSGDGGLETVEQATPSQSATEEPTLSSSPSAGPTAVEPEASTATAEEIPETPTPVAQPARESSAITPARRERRIAQAEAALSSWASRVDPLPPVEFTGDIALIVLAGRGNRGGLGGEYTLHLARVYRHNGEFIRETLFSPEYLEEGNYYFPLVATPDASSIVATVCIDYPCEAWVGGGPNTWTGGRTAIYESLDGGVTWDRLTTFDPPWDVREVLRGEGGETHLVLTARLGFFNEVAVAAAAGCLRTYEDPDDTLPGPCLPVGTRLRVESTLGEYWQVRVINPENSSAVGQTLYWVKHQDIDPKRSTALSARLFSNDVLWSGGEMYELPHPPSLPEGYEWARRDQGFVLTAFLDDGRRAWGMREAGSDQPPIYLTTDGEDVTGLVPQQERHCSSIWNCVSLPNDRILFKGDSNTPTIRDIETGEQWQIRLPDDIFSEDATFFRLLAVQQGPFLQVADMSEECLPLRAKPSLDAKELACVAERVLLQDQGDTATDDGITWHRASTPAGVEGWADGSYLE